MRIILLLIILFISSGAFCFARKPVNLPATVDYVELDRYVGLWYQFAYFPNKFQPKDAALVTAEYSLSPKGYIVVKNIAWWDWEGTKIRKKIKGKAFLADKRTSAKLRVQFFWPFRGDYWIVLLDKQDYRWVVVSEPRRRYLWILTRDKYLHKETYEYIIETLENSGFDLRHLEMTGRF